LKIQTADAKCVRKDAKPVTPLKFAEDVTEAIKRLMQTIANCVETTVSTALMTNASSVLATSSLMARTVVLTADLECSVIQY
jgi:hypothetical protein